MTKRNVWVNTKNQVKVEGVAKPVSTHRTQGAAWEVGRRLAKARECELIVQRVKGPNKGRILSRDSYGPESPKRDTEH